MVFRQYWRRMKKILFIRHAESAPVISSALDHGRELTTKGEEDAKYMGERLILNKILPDSYITSSAVRASATCEIIKNKLNNNSHTIVASSIYHDGLKGILANINSVSDDIELVAMVGHNPILREIYNSIKGVSCNSFPPCAIFLCVFDVEKWIDFSIENSQVLYHDSP